MDYPDTSASPVSSRYAHDSSIMSKAQQSDSEPNEMDLDAEGIALLREIFPGLSDEELRRLHRNRLETSATQPVSVGPKSKLGKRVWKQALYLNESNGSNESLQWRETDLPLDFLRLPKEVAVRCFNDAKGEWEYNLVADMERRVLKQHKSYQDIVESTISYPVDELHYSCSIEREPNLGLGISLCEQAGCIWVHSIVGRDGSRWYMTPPASRSHCSAVRGGIRPGDWLLGVQGQALLPSQNGAILLKYAVSAIQHTPDPVVLHLRHVPPHQFHPLAATHSGRALLDATGEAIDEKVLSNDQCLESNSGNEEGEQTPPIHPFVVALFERGLISSMEEQVHATECLKMYTNRARQWESTSSFRIEEDKFRLRHHFDPRDLPRSSSVDILQFDYADSEHIHPYAPSTPFLNPKVDKLPPHYRNGIVGVRLDDCSSDMEVQGLLGAYSPGNSPLRSKLSYPGDRRRRHEQMDSRGDSDIFIPLLGVRKALCVRVLNTFQEDRRTAYTIWVYDVESGREWYAPVRYLRDFQDLRSSTRPLCASIAEIPFPPVPGWITLGMGNTTESETVRDIKCRQLENFLRTLCTMIYTDPLHPNVAEIAIHVQSFLGCDIGLSDISDPALHLQNQVVMTESMWGQRGEDGHTELQMRVRLLLKRSVQRFTYRLLLLDCTKRIINGFVNTARSNGPTLHDIELLEAQGPTGLKERAMSELEKLQGFLDQLQDLILCGCMSDFDSIAQRQDFFALHRFISINKGTTYLDRLIREAVREQIEIEVYVPLRGVLSRLLVNGWRHDDIAMQLKIQELRVRPQSFFRIPWKSQSPSDWMSVSRIMKEGIGMSTLPCAKLRAIVDSAREITRLYAQEHGDPPTKRFREDKSEPSSLGEEGVLSSEFSADDFLPIFIFAVVRAELERPSALCILLRSLCDRPGRTGEIGYYLASFEAAITHIQELDLTDN